MKGKPFLGPDNAVLLRLVEAGGMGLPKSGLTRWQVDFLCGCGYARSKKGDRDRLVATQDGRKRARAEAEMSIGRYIRTVAPWAEREARSDAKPSAYLVDVPSSLSMTAPFILPKRRKAYPY